MVFVAGFHHNNSPTSIEPIRGQERTVGVAEYVKRCYRVASSSLDWRALEEWFDTPTGRALLTAERARCSQLSTPAGFRLVHLGVAPGHGVEMCFRQHCRFSLAEVQSREVDAVVAFDALPLPSDTVDVVVLHHILDFAHRPHQVLVEAARTLRPGGRLVLVGFDPYSIFGIGKWLLSPRRKLVVWRHNSLRRARLVDWLALLGFAVDVSGGGARSRWRMLVESRGAASYVVVATKRAIPLQPLQIKARARGSTLRGAYPARRSGIMTLRGGE